ncbi:coatomer subunit beta, putative [Plasmodium berghei]|uniref:Coatomer subunit beta' n=2 Tax=Plasmodium berghei TaxID=5821 RepID=A0A509AFQ6_PLABA|nr:coatomer subunit beta, putative [Plasmodium berghei ANKA]CXI04062.1 coatomer subunit beta, putative [Plasmodium berghei]SCL92210.1 coatomer subunit beta, putative [Plasmodium berghei]SCM15615.1 coatomer subunit beta, putative [Plasmodium berghei]SCM17407.1 coatomer subunit beta, putative [Plasmodium berghei]SCN22688.1 coatomer subunit beta, putative [Plasmodium berghei]|eukprot:XP_034420212.1 coatomer subunit beta, putative [Plasmodium berghei ANKA]
MPLNLDIKKKLNSRIGKVKCVDIHENEPWILAALYNGKLIIFDYSNQNTIKNIEVSGYPLRCAKFIEKKQWIICTGDDMIIRVYNYNTFEKIIFFEGHSDYIRYIEVHQTLPYILTCSDDMSIKLYDYENNFEKLCSFENHVHYVMMCKFNPKDTYIFASASLDKTIKIWGVQNNMPVVTKPHFTLTGHIKGVNCIDYSSSGETSYIISGSDDKTIRVWDYHTKQCVHILSGHTQNISCLIYHSNLPIIISSSEDCNVKIWNSSMYKLETTLNYNMDKCWSICAKKTKNDLCIGYDEGLIVIQMGSDKPIYTMFKNKIIYIKNADIFIINLQNINNEDNYNDGDIYKVNKKELGNCDFYPTNVSFHPNGRFVCVSGHQEFNIYTSQVLRNKAYGKSPFFVWGNNGDYAIKDEGNKIVIYKEFTAFHSFQTPYNITELFGGYLLGVKSNNFICFYDWNYYNMIRKIDINVKNVYWNDSGTYVAISTEESVYILSYNTKDETSNKDMKCLEPNDNINMGEENGNIVDENNFELENEINEYIESGIWIYDSFVYVSRNLRLYIYTKKFNDIYVYIDKYLYICGYVYEYDRIFLLDTNYNFYSFHIPIAYLQYQKYIINKDFEFADNLLSTIPEYLHNKLSLFLEKMGYKNKALTICTDLEKKFELALSIGNLQLCIEIIKQIENKEDKATVQNKYKALGDTSLIYNDISMAIHCYKKTNDYSSLLIILSTLGDKIGIEELGKICLKNKKYNIAFICYFLLHKINKCVDILVKSKNYAYASFFSRIYKPSLLPNILLKWKNNLNKTYQISPIELLTPDKNPEYFPDYELAIKCESIFEKTQTLGVTQNYSTLKKLIDINIMDEINEIGYEQVENIFVKQFDIDLEKDVKNFDMINSLSSVQKKETTIKSINEIIDKEYVENKTDSNSSNLKRESFVSENNNTSFSNSHEINQNSNDSYKKNSKKTSNNSDNLANLNNSDENISFEMKNETFNSVNDQIDKESE